jgi:Calcium binding
MRKPARDQVREDRIQDEAIVDAYGPEEQAMGWY